MPTAEIICEPAAASLQDGRWPGVDSVLGPG